MRFPGLRFIYDRKPRIEDDPGALARVEEMRVQDLDQVLLIERGSYLTPWSRRAFISELTENAYALYLVARRGSRVVGYIGMWQVVDEGHITNVAVHPDERGKGYGRLLMEAAMQAAAERGSVRVTLEVRVSNLVAKNLYTSLGFHQVGVRRGYYSDNGEDAYVMVQGEMPGGGMA